MANAFENDPNCKALFRYESGAFKADSIGSASLAINGVYAVEPVIDEVTFWEGAASEYYAQYTHDPFYVDNEPSDFPLHNGSGQTTFSVSFAYYQTGANESTFTLLEKSQSFALILEYYPTDEPVYNILTVYVYGDVTYDSDIPITAGRWYYITITFDAATKELKLRVYDSDAETVATWSTTTTSIPDDNNNELYIGDTAYEDTAYIDEVAFFNDVLTPDEIDEMRGGTYDPSGSGASGQATTDDYTALNLGCIF